MIYRSALLALGAALAAPAAAFAQAADPALATISGLDGAYVEAMKTGGTQARYSRLLGAVDRYFDLPTMTRFAVGSAWGSYGAADQAALTKAFARLTAANLAHNFTSYDGETFKVNPQVETRGPDKLVRSQIVPRSDPPTDLNYRMRQAAGGTWKVIDVYYGSVSQLTAQRSDFASSAVPGGAAELAKKINAKADELLKG